MDWCKEEIYRKQEAIVFFKHCEVDLQSILIDARSYSITTPQNLLDSTPLLDGLQPPIRLLLVASPFDGSYAHSYPSYTTIRPSSMAGLRARGDL